jgi:hypothetical protein
LAVLRIRDCRLTVFHRRYARLPVAHAATAIGDVCEFHLQAFDRWGVAPRWSIFKRSGHRFA